MFPDESLGEAESNHECGVTLGRITHRQQRDEQKVVLFTDAKQEPDRPRVGLAGEHSIWQLKSQILSPRSWWRTKSSSKKSEYQKSNCHVGQKLKLQTNSIVVYSQIDYLCEDGHKCQ